MTLRHRDQNYQRSDNNASEIELSQPSRPKVGSSLDLLASLGDESSVLSTIAGNHQRLSKR
jgi:hypothetical protein